MEHRLEDEDNAEAGCSYDPSTVDVDDEEGETGKSQPAYEKTGILPNSSTIGDAPKHTTLDRALGTYAPQLATHATTFDRMLNVLRSRHAVLLSGMVALD
jgi:hypothetical protein